MVVGVLTLEIYLPESHSLKRKRFLLKGLKERIRNKFNVSFSEIGYTDKWQRSTLGAAVITNETGYADRILAKVVDHLNGNNNIELLDYSIEMR